MHFKKNGRSVINLKSSKYLAMLVQLKINNYMGISSVQLGVVKNTENNNGN